MKVGRFFKIVFTTVFTTIIAGGIVAAGALSIYKAAGGNVDFSRFGIHIKPDNKTVSFLLMGVDAEKTRADVIMLLSFREKDRSAILISIPRDTKVETKRYDKKINSAYNKHDKSVIVEEVRKITGIRADYYAVVDFKGFRNLIDSIGGVKVNIPVDMDYDDPVQGLHIHLKKGVQILNGNKAEQFVRYRKNNDGTGYTNGDIGRIEAQHEFLGALMKQALNPVNIIKAPEIVNNIRKYIDTNIPSSEMGRFVQLAFDVKAQKVDMLRIPGEAKTINDISYFIYDRKKTKLMVDSAYIGKAENKQAQDSADMQKAGGDVHKDSMVSQDQQELKVEVLNATGRSGLAASISKELEKQGYRVVKTGNYETSKRIDTGIIARTEAGKGKCAEIRRILKTGKIKQEMNEGSGIDITVIIGDDYK